jgi:hypothetical protein
MPQVGQDWPVSAATAARPDHPNKQTFLDALRSHSALHQKKIKAPARLGDKRAPMPWPPVRGCVGSNGHLRSCTRCRLRQGQATTAMRIGSGDVDVRSHRLKCLSGDAPAFAVEPHRTVILDDLEAIAVELRLMQPGVAMR